MPCGAPQGLRSIPGEAAGRGLSDSPVLGGVEAGAWEALGDKGATWPDLAHPSPVEPLSGNLVEKNCSVWCTPTNSQQGQVSKGQETTLCCKSDLCNEGLQSPQSAAPARTSAPLGLALVCGLLVLLWAPGL